MSDSPQPDRRRLPFVIASSTVLVAAAVAGAIAINNANGSTPTGTPSPTASVAATATPNTSMVPFADCSQATFGPALVPLNTPSNPHVYAAPPVTVIDPTKLYEATITTAKGVIVVCLQPSLAPLTVNNFVVLARNHYYDGIPFHRVGPDSTTPAVVQGGDPNCVGNPSGPTCGRGGPGYSFADEPVRQQYVAGTIAMANSGIGKNTNGSQFFIDKDDETQNFQLQNGLAYNLFGKVVTGMSVVNAIVKGDIMQTVTVSQQQ